MIKKSMILSMAMVVLVSGVLATTGLAKTTNVSHGICQKNVSTITAVTPGGAKDIKAGDKFIIALKENVTTGYSWSYKISDEKGITLFSEATLAPKTKEGETPLVGAGSDRVWEFSALKAGKYTITFEYKRPFEKAPIEVLTYKVTVK